MNAYFLNFICSFQAAENQVTLEQQKERREQHIQRLKEINAKRRLEKVIYFIFKKRFISYR